MAYSLLALCLSILALRVTYTEAPAVQMTTVAGGLTDTIYSLTLSGLLIFAFVAWIVVRFVRNRPLYRFTGMEVGLGLFIAGAVVSSFFASDKRAAINHATILVAPIFGALLLSQILDSPGKVRLVLIVIVALGIVSAYQCAEQAFISNAITIEQYEKDPNMLLGPLGIEPGTFQHFLFEHRVYSRGVRGFFTTSNSAASFAICAFFAGAALLADRLVKARSRREDLRYVGLTSLAMVLILAGLLLTQSKGGIAAFVVGLAVFGLLVVLDRRIRSHRVGVRVVLVSSILLCIAAAGITVVHYGVTHGRLPGNSMFVRWQYWTASARMYADHPIAGVGPGNFSDNYTHYKPPAALESVADPHNWPLSLILQYGPLGLLGFVAMLCLPLWRSILPTPETTSDDASNFPVVPKAMIVGILLVTGLCLLLVRPMLIPTSGTDDFGVRLYEIITLFVTPAGVFLVGYLLAAAPFELRESSSGLARPALTASLVAAVLAVLLHSLIDFALFEPGVWMTFWTLLACLATLRFQRGPTADPAVAHRSSRRKQLLACAAFMVFVAFVLWVWMPVYRTTVGIAASQRALASARPDLAHAALEDATRADRFSAAAPNLDGRLYLQQSAQVSGRAPAILEQAARFFREALERNPADYKNYEKLAMVYSQEGKQQEAYDWYLKAAGLYPGCERLWFELGQLAERLKQPQVALGHYKKAVEIEEQYREQFRTMYPDRTSVVSRLGEKEYRLARERIAALQ